MHLMHVGANMHARAYLKSPSHTLTEVHPHTLTHTHTHTHIQTHTHQNITTKVYPSAFHTCLIQNLIHLYIHKPIHTHIYIHTNTHLTVEAGCVCKRHHRRDGPHQAIESRSDNVAVSEKAHIAVLRKSESESESVCGESE